MQIQNEADGALLTWNAGTDRETPVAALRYNVFIKLKNGQVFTMIPANITTGSLIIPNVNNAIATRSFKVKASASDIESWGVQTIDQAKSTSSFAVAQTTGISNTTVQEGNADVTFTQNGFQINTTQDAHIYLYDVAGNLLEQQTIKNNTSYTSHLPKGVYILKVQTNKKNQTFKVISK